MYFDSINFVYLTINVFLCKYKANNLYKMFALNSLNYLQLNYETNIINFKLYKQVHIFKNSRLHSCIYFSYLVFFYNLQKKTDIYYSV